MYEIQTISPLRKWGTLGGMVVLSIALIWGGLDGTWPLSLLAIGLQYMGTFFHELGHTILAWIFGYPTLPAFDFVHGGGMAWNFGRQMPLQWIFLAGWAGGVVFVFMYYGWVGLLAGTVFLGYAAAALTEFHNVMINFMGHGAEAIIGTLILARVIFDRVPSRPGEFEIHALGGSFLCLNPIKMSLDLIQDPDARLIYYQQKGSEGFGDFSRISEYFGFANEVPVAGFFIGFDTVCLGALFVSYYRFYRR